MNTEHLLSPPLQGPQLLRTLLVHLGLLQAVWMTYGVAMGSMTPTSPEADRLMPAHSEGVTDPIFTTTTEDLLLGNDLLPTGSRNQTLFPDPLLWKWPGKPALSDSISATQPAFDFPKNTFLLTRLFASSEIPT